MVDPKKIQVSQDVRDMYNAATTVQARYAFYSAYFEQVAPDGLAVVPIVDLGSGVRKEIRLLTWHMHKALFSGLVHRPSDKEADVVAADEAYTRVGNEERWDFFWFFTAADTLSFFAGEIAERGGSDGEWRLERMFHPINEAQDVHDYLRGKLTMFDDYLSEKLRMLYAG